MLKARAFASDYGMHLNLYLLREDNGRRFTVPRVDESALAETPEGMVLPPTAVVSIDQAAQLMDDLWAAGVRPSRKHGLDYGAQGRHLEDMRAIAFAKLGFAKPDSP